MNKKKTKLLMLTLSATALIAAGVIVMKNMSLIHERVEDAKAMTAPDAIEAAALNESVMRAAAAGNLEELRSLLDRGGNIEYRDEYNWTALIQAAAMNRLDIVKFLVLRGADVNAQGNDGSFALQQAVMHDNVAMVRFLISREASPELRGQYGWTALQTARERSRPLVLDFFAGSGMTP